VRRRVRHWLVTFVFAALLPALAIVAVAYAVSGRG
jgi:hypothetical protein